MRKAFLIILAGIIAMTAATTPAAAAVDGITAENYTEYVKVYPDAYGYNIGEADPEYKPGEEYFYNEYTDHWNVDKVYDPALIPQEVTADTPETIAAETQKAAPEKVKKATKKVKKTKKTKKSKKSKKSKKGKKSKK